MNLRVITHSGEEAEVTVENFDSVQLATQLNDEGVYVVEIGGIIFSRIDIKMISPVIAK